jgi:hypothetical protein
VYRYSAADLTAIRRGADRSFTANGTTATLTMEFPASSITLLVLPLRVTGGQPGQPVDDVRPRIYLPKVDRQE